jgi:hypothetical protein
MAGRANRRWIVGRDLERNIVGRLVAANDQELVAPDAAGDIAGSSRRYQTARFGLSKLSAVAWP